MSNLMQTKKLQGSKMLLKDYLKKKKLSIDAFSRKADIHYQTIRRILKGLDVKGSTIARIILATKNQVTFNDLVMKKYKAKLDKITEKSEEETPA